MRKLDLYWKSNRERWEYMDVGRAFRTIYDSFGLEYTIIESGDM